MSRRLLALVLILLHIAGTPPPAPAASWGAGPFVPGDVTTYLYGPERTGFAASETAITPHTVTSLRQRSRPAFDAITADRRGTVISAQPVVAADRIFYGTWDGYERAASTQDGHTIWRTQIGREYNAGCAPRALGVASTPALAHERIGGSTALVLYVGGGDGAMYALNAASGAVLWRTPLGSPAEGYFLWSSPVVYRGSVYMGVASIGDCPNVPGSVVKLDAATGAVQASALTAPPGCFAGDVWGSLAVDTAAGTLYFATGNISPQGAPPGLCTAAVEEVRAGDLRPVGRWAVPAREQVLDSDFGSTPTLFTAAIGGGTRRLVGMINKNGVYYAFERDRLGAGPVWQTPRLSIALDAIGASAWDGTRLYVATHTTTIGGKACNGNFGSLRALDPASGRVLWADCLFGGPAFAPVTAAPGVVFAAIGSHLYALDPATGREYFSFQTGTFHWYYAPPVVSRGVLYAANSDGKIYTFSPAVTATAGG